MVWMFWASSAPSVVMAFKRAIHRGNEKQASDTKKRIGTEVEKVMIFSMVRFWFVLFETWLW